MKRFGLILLIGLLSVNLFAQNDIGENNANKIDPYMIDNLISTQFKTISGKQQVYELSEGLTSEQKGWLYDKNEKSGVGPFFLNFFLGFGIGSFVQGDTNGGSSQLCLSLGGLGLDIIGLSLWSSAFYTETTWKRMTTAYSYTYYPYTEKKFDSGKFGAGCTLIAIGGILNTVSAIIGYIRPWTYASNYNKDLKRALRYNQSPWMTVKPQFAPIIDPINNNYGLVAKINL